MSNETTAQHKIVTPEEWLTARLQLLEDEKELTRRSDALARRRQELPWVRVDKDYRFDTDEGKASLAASPQSWATEIASGCGTDWPTYRRETPGVSAFVIDEGVVYDTYSAYARGLDGLWGMYQWLDRAPRGRNEEEPGLWWRRHDEYED